MDIQRLPRLSDALGISLSVKRDDLFPFTGGGNKARKVRKIFEELEASGSNAVVTCGGCQSNHARVVALAAAERGWPCKLILHGDPDDLESPRGNLLLMQLSGADIKITAPNDIDRSVKSAIAEFRDVGLSAFEIFGGGHSLAGGLAYLEAMTEVRDAFGASGPAWIIHASGTGSTQAGLIAGTVALGWQTRIIGISVARAQESGRAAIKEICGLLAAHAQLGDLGSMIDFRDDWASGGYQAVNEKLLAMIAFAARTEGLILDPTYTGKAFQGLVELAKSGEIEPGAEVLFWHTGGLLNLLAHKSPEDFFGRRSGASIFAV